MNYTSLQNVNPEIRAYIYQQLADLEVLLPEGSAISISIDNSDKKMVETAIKIETPYGEISALEESVDIYECLNQAKENLVKQLGEIHRIASEQDESEMPTKMANIDKTYIH